jgi:hypothetical protein
MGVFDEVFFLDDRLNNSNIVGALYFDEFEFESMRDYLMAKSSGLHKCRSKVVKRYGMYWYLKMSKEEWESKKNKNVVLIDYIHDEEQLTEFMCKEHSIREPLDMT